MNNGNGDEFCDEHPSKLSYIPFKRKVSNAAKQNSEFTYFQKGSIKKNAKLPGFILKRKETVFYGILN